MSDKSSSGTEASGTAAARATQESPDTMNPAEHPASEAVTLAAKEQRLSEIREQYRSGKYHVDPRLVSKKIVEHHLRRKAEP